MSRSMCIALAGTSVLLACLMGVQLVRRPSTGEWRLPRAQASALAPGAEHARVPRLDPAPARVQPAAHAAPSPRAEPSQAGASGAAAAAGGSRAAAAPAPPRAESGRSGPAEHGVPGQPTRAPARGGSQGSADASAATSGADGRGFARAGGARARAPPAAAAPSVAAGAPAGVGVRVRQSPSGPRARAASARPSGAAAAAAPPHEPSRWIRRQDELWRLRCPCEHAAWAPLSPPSASTAAGPTAAGPTAAGPTAAGALSIPALYAQLPAVLVLDLRDAKWNGLGNSLPRWVDMLRLGVALGRATFLYLSDCSLDRRAARAAEPGGGGGGGGGGWDLLRRRSPGGAAGEGGDCQFDLGEYLEGFGGVRWQWSTATRARVHAAMRARGVRETRAHYCNYTSAQVSALLAAPHPGCTTPTRFGVGGRCHYPMCMNDTYAWLTGAGSAAAAPWLYIDRIAQLDSAMFAPMRRRLRADCSDGYQGQGVPRLAACPYYGWLAPTAGFRATLEPYLAALDAFDAVVTVHFRSRYVDFAGAPHSSWERQVASRYAPPDVSRWDEAAFVDGIEALLRECESKAYLEVAAPCALHSVTDPRHARDHLDDRFYEHPAACGDGSAEAAFAVVTAANGPIARALTCAGRMAHTLARGLEPAALGAGRPWWQHGRAGTPPPNASALVSPAWYARPQQPHAGAPGGGPDGGGGARGVRWGLFVMSDTPALMQYVRASAQLRGHVVQTRGVFAHNSYAQACSGKDSRGNWLPCARGRDPGGGWTRIVLDHYLASLTDGLVGLPQSTFQDAVHMHSFTTKPHFLAFHFITRSWTRREFRDGIVTVLQGKVRPSAPRQQPAAEPEAQRAASGTTRPTVAVRQPAQSQQRGRVPG